MTTLGLLSGFTFWPFCSIFDGRDDGGRAFGGGGQGDGQPALLPAHSLSFRSKIRDVGPIMKFQQQQQQIDSDLLK